MKLNGKKIPLISRIVAIADAFDSMIHDRPYRKAMTVKEAANQLKKAAGNQFDPELTIKFLEIIEEEYPSKLIKK